MSKTGSCPNRILVDTSRSCWVKMRSLGMADAGSRMPANPTGNAGGRSLPFCNTKNCGTWRLIRLLRWNTTLFRSYELLDEYKNGTKKLPSVKAMDWHGKTANAYVIRSFAQATPVVEPCPNPRCISRLVIVPKYRNVSLKITG